MKKYLIILIFLTQFLSAESLEKVIADANLYTVKIDTSTDVPFIEDGYYSSGTGFLVDREKGFILTNKHVSSQSPSIIDIYFKDQDYIDGSIAYVDPIFDMAIVTIDPKLIPDFAVEAPIACDQVSVQGESVVAFGHPAGQDFTASTGIISGQRFELSAQAEYIQTDAAINGGNSGGPLISVKTNKIIGINTYGIEAEGLNFAIPSEHLCPIVSLFQKGVDPSPAQIPYVFASNTNKNSHLTVSDYLLFSPNNCGRNGNASSGEEEFESPLRVGDEILAVNGVAVENPSDVYSLLRGEALDQPLKLEIKRDHVKQTLEIPKSFNRYAKILDRKGLKFSGVLVGTDLTSTDRMENEIYYNFCKYLTIQVVDTGPAYGDLYRYDQIISVDGKKFFDLDSLHEFLSKKEKAQFIVRRIEYFDDLRYVVDVAKSIDIEDVEYLTF